MNFFFKKYVNQSIACQKKAYTFIRENSIKCYRKPITPSSNEKEVEILPEITENGGIESARDSCFSRYHKYNLLT
ncbi:MAG TPA: hypothetical protein VE912_24055 [Bacteroidales bacterium]|nr:hypothetical protein [Bacteroidales bacterium]